MAKHFNCWSEALGRPVTVIKPIENDPFQDDSSATFSAASNGNEFLNRTGNSPQKNVPKKTIIVRAIQGNKPKNQQNQRKISLIKHKCKICGHDFGIRLMNEKTEKEIEDHKKKHGPFNEMLRIQKHSEQNVPSFVCSICGKNNKDKYMLNIHMRCIHPEHIIKKMDTIPTLTEKRTVVLKKPIPKLIDATPIQTVNKERCNICGYKYKYYQRNDVENHAKKHVGEKYLYKYQCPYCPRRLKHNSKLLEHIRQTHKSEHKNIECSICGNELGSELLLQNHIKNVHPNSVIDDKEKFPRLYECFDCKRIFGRYIELHWHMNEHIDWLKEIDSIDMDKLFLCAICNEAYAEKSLLMYHAAAFHKLAGLLSCDICEMYFQTKAEYDEHRKRCVFEFEEHRDKCVGVECSSKFRCESCPQSFHKADTLEIHVRMHTQEKPYECIICHQHFGKFFYFRRHMQGHLSVSNGSGACKKTIFKCAWCKYSTSNYLLYTTHKKNHTTRIYECEYDCKDAFDTQQKLVEHVQHSHHDQLKSIKCGKCFTEFSLTIRLFDHSLSHIKESEQYVCTECGKVFHKRVLLKAHTSVHLDKTFECSRCPSKFKTKRERVMHIEEVHSSKKITCNICNKVYSSHSTFQKHKREKHKFGRRFQCESCPMRFFAKFHLQNHMRIHTGEKPFKCDHCDKAFAQKGELSSHIRVHLGPTPHKCTDCGESFRLVTELRKHSYKHFKPNNKK